MKPALGTQELVGEDNTTILSILGLAQGYIMTGEQPAMKQLGLVTSPMHTKETVRLRQKPKEDMLAED